MQKVISTAAAKEAISALCTRNLETASSGPLNVIYKDIKEFNEKVKKMTNKPFAILSDFDSTLTCFNHNGKKSHNSFDAPYVVSLIVNLVSRYTRRCKEKDVRRSFEVFLNCL